jgi:Ca2+-binding EF-hand superfamily protein
VKTFFKIFDLNVDGQIDDRETKRLFGTFGEDLSKNELQSLVRIILFNFFFMYDFL